MIWIKWIIQTIVIVLIIILGMVYGWGLIPKRWSVVIVCYILANAIVPACAFINHKIAKKMGWEIPNGYHIHKNPPKKVKRKTEDFISQEYKASHIRGNFPGRNMGD